MKEKHLIKHESDIQWKMTVYICYTGDREDGVAKVFIDKAKLTSWMNNCEDLEIWQTPNIKWYEEIEVTL